MLSTGSPFILDASSPATCSVAGLAIWPMLFIALS